VQINTRPAIASKIVFSSKRSSMIQGTHARTVRARHFVCTVQQQLLHPRDFTRFRRHPNGPTTQADDIAPTLPRPSQHADFCPRARRGDAGRYAVRDRKDQAIPYFTAATARAARSRRSLRPRRCTASPRTSHGCRRYSGRRSAIKCLARCRGRCRLPFAGQLLRFADLRWRHLRGDPIPTCHRVLDRWNSRDGPRRRWRGRLTGDEAISGS
jgi:hypothetical protein